MRCRDAVELADARPSDQLRVETSHEVLQHVAECPRCRRELEMRRRLRSALQRAFAASPELQPRREFLETLPDRVCGAGTRWRLTARAAAIAGLAAVLLLAAAAGSVWLRSVQAARYARLAAGDHENCAVRFGLGERPISLEEAARRFDSGLSGAGRRRADGGGAGRIRSPRRRRPPLVRVRRPALRTPGAERRPDPRVRARRSRSARRPARARPHDRRLQRRRGPCRRSRDVRGVALERRRDPRHSGGGLGSDRSRPGRRLAAARILAARSFGSSGAPHVSVGTGAGFSPPRLTSFQHARPLLAVIAVNTRLPRWRTACS